MRAGRKIGWMVAGLVVLAVAGGAAYAVLHHVDNGSTTGQRVNAAIDNLVATGVRLLELPTFVLLLGIAIVAAVGVIVTEQLAGGLVKTRLRRAGLITAGIVVLFSLALFADRRMGRLEKEITELKEKLSESRMSAGPVAVTPAAVAPAVTTNVASGATTAAATVAATAAASAPSVAATQRAPLFDVAAVKKDLAPFGNIRLRTIVFNQAVDAVDLHMDNPLIQAYVAVVDLATPGLQINLGGSLTEKTLTSEFMKATDSSVAINGEAGDSPQANSGLGDWTGNYIVQGKVMLTEKAGNRRPFLTFDKENHAYFTPQMSTDRAIRPDRYNVIWGRMDALIDGELQTAAERDRQPRTAMAIDKSGSKLYLLVVDGRAPQYSQGVTRGEVGMILRAFGAYNGMLCDEGGSSCMLFKGWGLVNTPSDGYERITYTHFGVTVKK